MSPSTAPAQSAARRVRVALPNAHIDAPLTYGVPARLSKSCVPGVRARVPLSGQLTIGVVLGDDELEPPKGLKLVDEIIDREPVVSERQLELAQFVARYYLVTLGEALRLVVPPDAPKRVRRRYTITDAGRRAQVFGTADGLAARDAKILDVLSDDVHRTLSQLKEHGGTRARLERLLGQGLVEEIIPVQAKARAVLFAEALDGGEELPPRSPALGAIDAWLRAQDGPVAVKSAQVLFSGARGKLKRLAALGRCALTEEARVARSVPVLEDARGAVSLTDDQATAVSAVVGAFDDDGGRAFLLEGVTGSGKTEVYLRALTACLERGRGAILVVPEIALTPQLFGRVQAAVPEEISVLHSALSQAERRDAITRLREGQARVALGARSALFAPVRDLGLIVVDEEHDNSLKQSDAPRYHGRDVALWRAQNEGAVCVLGSATPSLESRHNASEGKLTHLRLETRIGGGGALPDVEIVDLRERRHHGPTRRVDAPFDEGPGIILSRPLRDAIEQTLASGEQVLLFLNRRGFASVLVCESCGNFVECPHCSVSLTVHKSKGRAVCHQCDYSLRTPDTCVHCGHAPLVALGLGTERVEDEVKGFFPDARVGRLDRDTTSSKDALVDVLKRVKERAVDVLIGTQMVAKGHDFPGIALVGVILADVALSLPDFRAAERTFALLTQVAGRAGRGATQGRVLIQTYNPEHPAIAFAAAHDVERFSALELGARKAGHYPPFWRAALFRVEGEDPTAVDAVAGRVAQKARDVGRDALEPGTWDVLGPAPAPIERIKGKTRHQVFIRAQTAKGRARLLMAVKGDPEIQKAVAKTGNRLVLDVDPTGML